MISGWKQVVLGDIIHIKHGYGFKGEYFVDEPNNNFLLTPGNFAIGGGFKADKMKYYDGPIDDEFVLKPGDVIVTMTDLSKQADTLGYSAKIPNDPKNKYLHNQRLGLISLKSNDYDLNFIYWLLRTDFYQKYIAGSSSGATVKHTSPKKIYSAKLIVPESKETQRKIAAILSAYDDLIENNLKRIKLLEEKAQLTYEEWFVRMKFPGHESTPINEEKGLPEGWERLTLGDFITLNYGKALKSDSRISGPYKVYGSSGAVGTHIEAIVEGPGVIVGRKGNVGSVFWEPNDFYPIDTVYYVSSDVSLYFCFFNLKSQRFINNDAAVPGLNRSSAYLHKSFLPSIAILEKFDVVVKDLFDISEKYKKQNLLLQEARDILLPRLMTGMIDVEKLDLSAFEQGDQEEMLMAAEESEKYSKKHSL